MRALPKGRNKTYLSTFYLTLTKLFNNLDFTSHTSGIEPLSYLHFKNSIHFKIL